jgi:hypothetical protein
MVHSDSTYVTNACIPRAFMGIAREALLQKNHALKNLQGRSPGIVAL